MIPPSGQNVISTSLLPYVILDVFFCKCFALLFNTNIGGMCFLKIVLKLGYIQLGVAISLPIGRLPSKVGTPSQSWGTLSIAHISSTNSLSSRCQHHGHHNQQVILPRLSFFVLLFFALFIVDTISSKFSLSLGLTLTWTISLLLRLYCHFSNFVSLLSVSSLLSLLVILSLLSLLVLSSKFSLSLSCAHSHLVYLATAEAL